MRTGVKVGLAIGVSLVGLIAIYMGPSVLFLLFHDDWMSVPHLLTVPEDALALRVEVVDVTGEVLWAIENRKAGSARHIDYGSVPEGFVQLVPAVGQPRTPSKVERLGLSYCDSRGGGAFIQVRVRRGAIQHGLVYWGQRTDGMLCDRRFVYEGWTVPSQAVGS